MGFSFQCELKCITDVWEGLSSLLVDVVATRHLHVRGKFVARNSFLLAGDTKLAHRRAPRTQRPNMWKSICFVYV